MKEFPFGTLSTTEQRVAQVKARYSGVRHLHRRQPQAPAPDERPAIFAAVGLPQTVDRVVCTVLEPERATIEMSPSQVQWDLFNWAYYQTWQGTLPAYDGGTVVRYVIHAHPSGDGPPVAADEGQIFSYLVGRHEPPAWSREAVIYQVFPDRFYPGEGRSWRRASTLSDIHGGTIRGITERLEYVADLGFNCIWLNPFFPDETHHGYHATDYFKVDPGLGTLDDIRELVQEAHARGIRVLLDFVANHWGRGHPTFQEAIRDRHSPYHDWYYWLDWPEEYRTFFGVRDLPKVNVDHGPARQYMLRAADFWLREIDFDGYRLDYALGPSHDFWTDFRVTVRKAKPDAWIFGEVVETPPVQLSYLGLLDGTLDFLLMQALRNTFAFGTMDVAAFDAFLTLHETYFPTHFSRPSFLDNHDFNRFLWAAEGDKRRLKLAALCQFTLSGPPIVYYGTEVGLSQERDIVQGERGHIMEEARLPMLWDGEQDSQLRDYYTWLIHFRHEHPVLWSGDRETLHVDAASGTYAYRRYDGEQSVTVALNASDETHRFQAGGLSFDLDAWSGDVRSESSA
ncbi:MAG TPA: alpha-amylase family glycosyl hydrolase [Candidatus Sulfomarinibacteraceae bacterium]|nr:alpha-amylase family glycosyl hydrolase [Candidatus Sulfomarinibacteraceae bacterium]